jgi:hypothetical protein
MLDHKAGWLRFFMWGAAGACFALGVTAVGVFTVPLGALMAVWLARSRRSARELLGLFEGAGTIFVLIGALNLDYRSCPSGTVFLSPGQHGFSCGGVDGTPWLIVGVAAMLLIALTYWWASSRQPP